MDLLRLSALGGVLGLDGTAVGQFMLSRPLVAGAAAGWAVGDAALGITIGVVLELYLLVSFPSGGARFPEGATATVVAVSSAAPFAGAGVVPLAVAVGLVWGQVAGVTVDRQRHINARLVPDPSEVPDLSRVVRGHGVAIGIDFVRAAVVTGVGIAVGRLVVGVLHAWWPLSGSPSSALLLVGGAVSAGILLNGLGGIRRRRIWFVAGLAAGLVGSRLL